MMGPGLQRISNCQIVYFACLSDDQYLLSEQYLMANKLHFKHSGIISNKQTPGFKADAYILCGI